MSRLTQEQINSLDIGVSADVRGILRVESALKWVETKTIYEVDYNNLKNLPSEVLLFVAEYCDLLAQSRGVSSESIDGLSQSFDTSKNLETKIYELAYALLGADTIKSTVTVFSGEDRWDYEG